MQDEKLRAAPSPWPEGGDREFPGGRIKVLFVHDGARVSYVELQREPRCLRKRHLRPARL